MELGIIRRKTLPTGRQAVTEDRSGILDKEFVSGKTEVKPSINKDASFKEHHSSWELIRSVFKFRKHCFKINVEVKKANLYLLV